VLTLLVVAVYAAATAATSALVSDATGSWVVAAAAQQERSRIRRDLHDGLGPSLSGVALGLEAVQAALPDDPQTATKLTARMRTEIAGAVEDVRHIIDELRPAALEDVGLVQALRERAASLAARSASE
jgi:two-component system, NarL family, sensor kinase